MQKTYCAIIIGLLAVGTGIIVAIHASAGSSWAGFYPTFQLWSQAFTCDRLASKYAEKSEFGERPKRHRSHYSASLGTCFVEVFRTSKPTEANLGYAIIVELTTGHSLVGCYAIPDDTRSHCIEWGVFHPIDGYAEFPSPKNLTHAQFKALETRYMSR